MGKIYKMKILLLADYKGGFEAAKYLKSRGEDIVGLVVHPTQFEQDVNRGYTQKIIDTLNLPHDRIFIGDKVQSGECLDQIKSLGADIALVLFWGYILKKEFIELFPQGCINFHPALLPYNRGKNPNVWPLIEGTPAGITFHYIDEKIDSGDIITQKEILIESTDTAKTLYDKLIKEFMPLFEETWPQLKSGTAPRIKQPLTYGTFHLSKQMESISQIDLDQQYTGRELINLLRARTFLPYPGAYFIDDNGIKVYVRIDLKNSEVRE